MTKRLSHPLTEVDPTAQHAHDKSYGADNSLQGWSELIDRQSVQKQKDQAAVIAAIRAALPGLIAALPTLQSAALVTLTLQLYGGGSDWWPEE